MNERTNGVRRMEWNGIEWNGMECSACVVKETPKEKETRNETKSNGMNRTNEKQNIGK